MNSISLYFVAKKRRRLSTEQIGFVQANNDERLLKGALQTGTLLSLGKKLEIEVERCCVRILKTTFAFIKIKDQSMLML